MGSTDAMRRKQTTTCPSSERPLRHYSMAALPSAAESRRSSALGHKRSHSRTTITRPVLFEHFNAALIVEKIPAAHGAHNHNGSCRGDIGLGNAPGSCQLATIRQAAGIAPALTTRRADPQSALDTNWTAVELPSVRSLGWDCTSYRRSFAGAGHQPANACRPGSIA